MPQKKISIAGMHCRSCEILLEEELGKVAGVSRVDVNHKKGSAVLVYDGVVPSDEAVGRVVEKAGYRVSDGIARQSWFAKDIEPYVLFLFATGFVFILSVVLNRFGWLSLSFGSDVDAKSLGLVFLVGLTAGVSTCAALVGGLVLGVASRYGELHNELSWKEKFVPNLWFNAGRVAGFAILGSLLGMLGNFLSVSIGFTGTLTLFAGVAMLFLGLQLSELSPRLRHMTLTLPKGVSRVLGIQRKKDKAYSHRGAFTLGALTFFLPCGFTQAVQLAVVALGSPLFGALSLGIFALGTVPGLLLIGGAGTAVQGGFRKPFFAFIAVVLIFLGGWSVTNGLHLLGVNTTFGNGGTKQSEESSVPLENGMQVVRITQDARGYHPGTLPALEVGVPVRLIVDSKDSYTCASSFVIPQFGIQKRLEPGENVIEFTPKKKGSVAFSCSMGMFRGAFQVN